MTILSSAQVQLFNTTCSFAALLVTASCAMACGGSEGRYSPTSGDEGGAGGATTDVTDSPSYAGAGRDGFGEGGAAIVDCDDRPTESVTLDQPIWQTGFKVTLGTAVLQPATPSCSPGLLTIDAEFENRGADTQAFDARTLLTSAGKDYELPSYTSDVPEVPGERMSKGSFSFTVDDTFRFDDATLSFGGAGRHQAKVPLGKGSPDSLITLEPQSLPIKGKVVAGYLTVTFDGAYVVADRSSSYSSLAEDEVLLRFDFSAMVTTSLTARRDYISRDAFVLELPDGTSIAPEGAPFQALSEADVSVNDLWVSFMIPAPATGEYTLTVREMSGAGVTPHATAEFPFELPSFPTFGDK